MISSEMRSDKKSNGAFVGIRRIRRRHGSGARTGLAAFLAVAAAMLLLCAGGCAGIGAGASASDSYESQIFAMDTYMTITAYGADAQEAVTAAVTEINRLDALLSTENEVSEIYALNAAGGGSVSEDTSYLLERALEIAELTDGAFDIAVYPLMQLWGFPTQEYYVPAAEEIEALLPVTDIANVVYITNDGDTSDSTDGGTDGSMVSDGGSASGDSAASDSETASGDGTSSAGMLTLEKGAQIDLGGITKGYLSDCMQAIFDEYEITGAVCSLGGNIYTYGFKEDGSQWNIGIQDPEGTTSVDVIGALQVNDVSVITSGGYERYFEENGVTYHHILDPETGYPADSGLSSVTIVSADGTLADGLSTALFVMGADEAADLWRENSSLFEFILVDEEGNILISEGLDGNFEPTDSAAQVTVISE